MDVQDRQDALIRRLRRGELLSVEALAAEVGVSRRTVLRDIAALRDRGFVIDAEPGPGGGVQLDPGSVMTTARMTTDEVFGLLLSVAVMRAVGTMPFAGLADAGLARIERALPSEKVADLRAILACFHVGVLSPHQDIGDIGPVDPNLIGVFEPAFLRRQRLVFDYRDRHGARTRREVEPQAILILPPLWYLVAWDPAREGFRHFRMDRISGPTILEGPPFRRRRVPFEEDVCPWEEIAARHAAE